MDKELENLADEANIKGDNNLAIVLYTVLGARKAHMDKELAIHCQNWAKERVREIKQFNNRKNN
ncbi:hypothetical protein CL634_00225 [bacterium]|nr:hypothetical protein [bacterium]